MTLLQELDFLSELNWRLETALIPVWNDLVPSYERLLDTINPFPREITDLPRATLTLSDSTSRAHDWRLIREQWLSLALGLLRYYREERNADAFERMHARIGRLGEDVGDVRARWCYERCLFALGEMDDESVNRALAQWPSAPHDAFWHVREAALYAEIGQTAKATQLCDAALLKLRQSVSDTVEAIPTLSREGWTLWLGFALRSNIRWRAVPGDSVAEREELRRRFHQLKRYGCSPDELKDYFEGRLDQPPPQAKPLAETRPGFEPGTYSRTIHIGEDLWAKLLPAYQFYRLVEEAAQPPSIGYVGISGQSLKKVAEWFKELDPVRTQTIMLRLHDEKLVDAYASRHRVAALAPDSIQKLNRVARGAIDQSLRTAPAKFGPDTDEAQRVTDQLKCGIELLSRLSVRETEASLSDSWDFACALYRQPVVRAGLGLDEPLRHLFSNLIDATPAGMLQNRLPELFRLPVAGENDFLVSMPDRWPDPVLLVRRRAAAERWPIQTSDWSAIKHRLVELAANAEGHTKRAAFLRLSTASEMRALTPTELKKLSGIFWATAGDGLPIQVWQDATPWFALQLPEPHRRVGACKRVKHYILAQQLGQVDGGMVWPQGWFDLILFATERTDRPRDAHVRRSYIAWTDSDVRALFQTIQSWWQNYGRRAAEQLQTVDWRRAHDGPTVASFIIRLCDVMRVAIMPRLRGRDSSATAAVDMIMEIRSAGLPVGAVLPAVLLLRPRAVREIVSAIRQELASADMDHFLSALRGLSYWVNETAQKVPGKRSALPPIPADLLRETSMSVALRRPESLKSSLDFASSVLRCLGAKTDQQFIANLLIGLDYLISETRYHETSLRGGRYTYEDLPRVRWLAARLAKQLADCGHGTDPIILRWLEAIDADPLPEIRRITSTATES